MASYKGFAIFGFLLVNILIVIHSAPIEKVKETTQSSSRDNKPLIEQALLKSISSEKTSSTPEQTLEKKKRNIKDDLLDGIFESDSDEEDVALNKNHVLHAKIQETSEKIHDHTDKLVDTDDSKVFSDIQMTPNDLINVRRRRRDVKLNDRSNQRRKRALSPYDLYDTDSFYDPYGDLIEQEQYDRPIRSFAPIYWYPNSYQRSLRSVLPPSLYESSEWPYTNVIDDEIEETPTELVYDNEEDYESNHYPILLQSSEDPLDSLELQQQYGSDDLPIDENRYDENEENSNVFDDDEDEDDDDEDDDDEEAYLSSYPTERPLRLWVV